jgi:hypothetical protein
MERVGSQEGMKKKVCISVWNKGDGFSLEGKRHHTRFALCMGTGNVLGKREMTDAFPIEICWLRGRERKGRQTTWWGLVTVRLVFFSFFFFFFSDGLFLPESE